MFWDNCRHQLRKKINSGLLKHFRDFSKVRHTMYVGSNFLDWQLPQLTENYNKKDITLFKHSVVNDEDFGCLINQYYHLEQFKKNTNIEYKDFEHVLEFGAGIGAMYHVLSILGKIKSYTIIDLPEVIAIQKEYFRQIGANIDKITFIDSTHVDYNKISKQYYDCFIAMWSLSEVDNNRPDINVFNAKNYIIGFQNRWTIDSDIDNNPYFLPLINKNGYNMTTKNTLQDSKYVFGTLDETRYFDSKELNNIYNGSFGQYKKQFFPRVQLLVEEYLLFNTVPDKNSCYIYVSERLDKKSGLAGIILYWILPYLIKLIINRIFEKTVGKSGPTDNHNL